MASFRHLARTCVMQALFAYEFRGGDPDYLLKYMLAEFAPKLSEKDFAIKTLKGVLKYREKILQIISTNAPQWPVEKIARVDRAILEIGVYEVVFSKDVPPVVAINEAIETAKHFGDTNSSKFVNGVLSAVMNANINTKKNAKKSKIQK